MSNAERYNTKNKMKPGNIAKLSAHLANDKYSLVDCAMHKIHFCAFSWNNNKTICATTQNKYNEAHLHNRISCC